MTSKTKDLLESVATWPEEDQQELLEVAKEIEGRRRGTYDASPEELAAVDIGIKAANEGRFASDEAVEMVRAKFRRV
jgi:hypothetical protein